jgi:uncharacterized protein with PIN domain
MIEVTAPMGRCPKCHDETLQYGRKTVADGLSEREVRVAWTCHNLGCGAKGYEIWYAHYDHMEVEE